MPELLNTFNYLVPASGTTHGFKSSGVFSATPTTIDFRNMELNGQIFVPSGVFIDNSAGTGDLIITVQNVEYSIICPAGARLQTQYPAPSDQQVSIVGLGQASLVFVDFPVIPFTQSEDIAAAAIQDLSQFTIGFDTAGDPLPNDFQNLPQTLSYTGAVLDSIAKTDGVDTWTQSYTYTGANLTGISGWVKS